MRAIARRLLAALMVVAAYAASSAEAPDALVRSIVTGVLEAYGQDKDRHRSDPEFLRGIVRARVVPNIDAVRMSRLVLGRHWRDASDGQRQAFTDAYIAHLVRTYSAPIADYSGQGIEFLPYEPGANPERALVHTRIIPHEGEPIPVSYRLRLADDGRWKIYDLIIDEVSLVANYRSAYSLEISRNGLDALIASLSEAAE